MSQKMIFRYGKMEEAANAIDGYAKDYADAATALNNAVTNAIADWEGASKEKFVTFMNSVNTYTGTTIPEVVKGMAEVLRANATSMQEADSEIAKAIPDSI